jgi:mRNA-degrading endonuclease RelE of RelBE toxin-antitoxin system
VDAQRLRGQVKDLEARAGALEARLERARERERDLEAEAERLRTAAAASIDVPPAAAAGGDGDAEPEEAPATWLMPVYTREFYDSLAGWDRRVQRAAFKQAALLAQDHRHPSLRALPLEGLPGYYRVRVATDVRLLYRRTERQNTIEILSLIDREDLDRYIKQAKTR